ncbi:MAG: NAD(P)/FAD-dependent oxidoreductase [Candidatus Melainabacteria bacterium]|nr:NAD(P)/FAD-dependent oxidoreductase [Candidatus Melainabacteria bacterium]
MAHPKVIIIGGGFGGLTVAKSLKKANLDLLLIDKTNHHLFQPLLYEVATAALSPGDIATPLREILRNQDNTSVIMGEVVAIDKQKKEITIANGDVYSYDYLVIAIGARHSYFGHNEWETFAPGLKTINDALSIREEILISFEKAERLANMEEAAKYLNFVIIGGGPTGVEMAGAIAEIAYKTMFKNFRRIRPEKANIYLIEALPHILPMYPEKLSQRATHDLEKMGVQVLTGKKVTAIHDGGVQTEEMFIESMNVIWAAGNQVSTLLKALDVPLDRAGRAMVGADLTLPGHPEIFVIGDAAHSLTKDGKPLPGVAPVAVQQGNYVAKILKKEIPKDKRAAFAYFDKGSMATIGKAKAIAMVGKFQFSGFFAWLMWAFVHIMYLIGYRNRLGVMLEWAAMLITGERGVRIISRPIDKEIPKSK